MGPYDSIYRIILIAAERARQLKEGSPPKLKTSRVKPHMIALEEVFKKKFFVKFTNSAGQVVEVNPYDKK